MIMGARRPWRPEGALGTIRVHPRSALTSLPTIQQVLTTRPLHVTPHLCEGGGEFPHLFIRKAAILTVSSSLPKVNRNSDSGRLGGGHNTGIPEASPPNPAVPGRGEETSEQV